MAVNGCLIKKSADQTTADYDPDLDIAWDTEIYDTHGFHAGSDEEIIIPASMDGKHAVLTAQVSTDLVGTSDNRLYILRDAAFFKGMGYAHNANANTGQGANQNWMQVSTGPVLLATGQSFTARMLCEDASITVTAAQSTFGIRILDRLTTHRVLCKLNADLTTQNFTTPAVIPFNGADVFDTDAIHDPSSNNSKLIIPSALDNNYVVVRSGVNTGVNSGGDMSLAIRKNGSLSYDGFGGKRTSHSAQTSAWVTCITQPIQVATGDEFEALFYQGTDSSITIASSSTYLSLQAVG